MDGIHDLGGKQGYGPINTDDTEDGFRHDWERRMWALAREGGVPNLTIDYFRHGLERMVPRDYVSFPYFGKWCTNYMMLFVQEGVFTLDELKSGKTSRAADVAPKSKSAADVVAQTAKMNLSFELEAPSPAKHAIGDTVTTCRTMSALHTRLPQYARSATGKIIAHHGAHAMPDRNVEGTHVGEHLYTVEFAATELFGEEADPKDTVTLDLWESYFV